MENPKQGGNNDEPGRILQRKETAKERANRPSISMERAHKLLGHMLQKTQSDRQ